MGVCDFQCGYLLFLWSGSYQNTYYAVHWSPTQKHPLHSPWLRRIRNIFQYHQRFFRILSLFRWQFHANETSDAFIQNSLDIHAVSDFVCRGLCEESERVSFHLCVHQDLFQSEETYHWWLCYLRYCQKNKTVCMCFCFCDHRFSSRFCHLNFHLLLEPNQRNKLLPKLHTTPHLRLPGQLSHPNDSHRPWHHHRQSVEPAEPPQLAARQWTLHDGQSGI